MVLDLFYMGPNPLIRDETLVNRIRVTDRGIAALTDRGLPSVVKERGLHMFRMLTRCVLVAALVASAAPAFAQPAQTGTISGAIQDATGAALPGVTVTITSQDRGFSRSTVSDENGRYVFPAVPIGPYTIVATLQGFETAQATDNLVETDRTTNVAVRDEDRRPHRHGHGAGRDADRRSRPP